MASTMTTAQFIASSYLIATGKTTALTSGSTKYNKLLALGNYFQKIWAGEPGTDWESLRTTFTLASTVSATDTYALPATVGKITSQEGDYVRITTATMEYVYDIVPSTRLYDSELKLNHFDNNRVAVVGTSLVFARTFKTTDPQYGGTITVPGYSIPADLVDPGNVHVDDPNWLVQMSAAEFVRTDITRRDQYPNLVAMANETMASMKDQNGAQIETVYTGWRPGTPNDYPWN